jgi:hypothetical protein
MSTAVTVHGFRIADGGALENAVVEKLVTDPSPIEAGRLWYNTTEKKIKFSSLNGTGAVVVESFSSAAELAAAVASAKSELETADAALGVRIDNVLSNVDADAIDSLTEIISAFESADGTLNGAITALSGQHTSELASTKSDLEQADTDLSDRIDTLESSVGGSTGDNANLTTDHKLTLVGAISEVDGNADANAASIVTTNGVVASNKTDIEGKLSTAQTTLQDNIDGNTTALNGYKTSNDQALADEAARATAAEGVNATAVTTEKARAEAAEGVNATAIATEKTRAEGAEGALTTDLATEVTRAKAAEGVNATAISDEETRATGAEGVIQAALDAYKLSNDASVAAEVLARGNADDALDARIDNVLSNLDPVALDSLTEIVAAFQGADSDLQTAITAALGTHTSELAAAKSALEAEDTRIEGLVTSEAATARAAELVNANAISTEKTRAETAEGVNAQAISDEETRAKAAEGVNAAAITAEATTARAAEGVNAQAIVDETTRATAAEGVNATAIATEATTARVAESDLQDNIDAEETRATAAEGQIRADIDAGKASGQSATAATVHTIAHGLGSAFVNFGLMVDNGSGVYMNDVAPVTEIDNSTLKVELSAARMIKWTAIRMDAIS